jgi:hypothetical protein
MAAHPDIGERHARPCSSASPGGARRKPRTISRLDERPHRLSDRRCRHAPALAGRLDPQSRADDRGELPGEASADRLARRRALVLGHAGRRRLRQQQRQLAVDRRLRLRFQPVRPDHGAAHPVGQVRRPAISSPPIAALRPAAACSRAVRRRLPPHPRPDRRGAAGRRHRRDAARRHRTASSAAARRGRCRSCGCTAGARWCG